MGIKPNELMNYDRMMSVRDGYLFLILYGTGARRHILLHFHGRISRRQINSERGAETLSGRGACRK